MLVFNRFTFNRALLEKEVHLEETIETFEEVVECFSEILEDYETKSVYSRTTLFDIQSFNFLKRRIMRQIKERDYDRAMLFIYLLYLRLYSILEELLL